MENYLEKVPAQKLADVYNARLSQKRASIDRRISAHQENILEPDQKTRNVVLLLTGLFHLDNIHHSGPRILAERLSAELTTETGQPTTVPYKTAVRLLPQYTIPEQYSQYYGQALTVVTDQEELRMERRTAIRKGKEADKNRASLQSQQEALVGALAEGDLNVESIKELVGNEVDLDKPIWTPEDIKKVFKIAREKIAELKQESLNSSDEGLNLNKINQVHREKLTALYKKTGLLNDEKKAVPTVPNKETPEGVKPLLIKEYLLKTLMSPGEHHIEDLMEDIREHYGVEMTHKTLVDFVNAVLTYHLNKHGSLTKLKNDPHSKLIVTGYVFSPAENRSKLKPSENPKVREIKDHAETQETNSSDLLASLKSENHLEVQEDRILEPAQVEAKIEAETDKEETSSTEKEAETTISLDLDTNNAGLENETVNIVTAPIDQGMTPQITTSEIETGTGTPGSNDSLLDIVGYISQETAAVIRPENFEVFCLKIACGEAVSIEDWRAAFGTDVTPENLGKYVALLAPEVDKFINSRAEEVIEMLSADDNVVEGQLINKSDTKTDFPIVMTQDELVVQDEGNKDLPFSTLASNGTVFRGKDSQNVMLPAWLERDKKISTEILDPQVLLQNAITLKQERIKVDPLLQNLLNNPDLSIPNKEAIKKRAIQLAQKYYPGINNDDWKAIETQLLQAIDPRARHSFGNEDIFFAVEVLIARKADAHLSAQDIVNYVRTHIQDFKPNGKK